MANWNKKRKVMQHYDNIATVYDTQYAEEQEAKIKAVLDEINLQPDNTILDIGCGTGILFKHIKNSAKLLIGLDTSLGLLKRAETQAKQYCNIVVIRAEADHTPFKNKTFHTIFAITLLQNMPNPAATLREIKRISKDNATIAVTALKKGFTKKTFTQLLENAELTLFTLKTDNKLKDYTTTCKPTTPKLSRKSC
ncbi:methyltransferase domain-containing protein [Candidatus Bathyarchaeota archaeon]|nr:methyltransferase domain-containing protein [Candidatus Bathyarchaeota archaeon]